MELNCILSYFASLPIYGVVKPLKDIHSHRQTNDKLIVKQAKGLGFMNKAKKDSHVDNNYKFAIYSLQSQVNIITVG